MTKSKPLATIELTLDAGTAAAGVDRAALVANVEAEISKLQKHANSKNEHVVVEEHKDPPPERSQDIAGAIQWVIKLIEDPALSQIYARGLIYGVNELLKAIKGDLAIKNGGGETKGVMTRVRLLNKEIALPVANKIIEEFLKSLDSGA